ncbi:cob(I)yrinic acid a,c-diamide adenosyltransferase [Candidatus Peregrinibacteria bacterium]|jgi:cob(I)alamin adenosyltransferase|nr:cob(I)yrinic acid a,c-diamide adenosyltransferase [Candidatus Peregrinibacteria bacterium]MBT4147838.1 cob(I)yrinic acid a,c-diamide adenosyltransferase [Candidatus Peregrinibacteria bacterium]MBT4366179.1 cob(I)yrinic acid a,c-diamide adenosyltransferase [Candidatus Peregrinibacteria bacterium]MBT4455584.1 cob(I)yrinic acid a,c-diamide adenosyltransferase [Candidatus Peregrinibacteria bacterium]
MKIYTGLGDSGKTKLLGPRKYSKNSKIMNALGEIDELNSFVGLAACKVDRSTSLGKSFMETLDKVQEDLYRIGTEIAGANMSKMSAEDVTWAEGMIDKYWSYVKGVTVDEQSAARGKKFGKFVKPGEKGELCARFHICRTVARRAERSMYNVFRIKRLVHIRKYLNRLSDLLFVMGEC